MNNKEKFIQQYEMVANGDTIDRLYMYQCLLYSGFDKDKVYDLIDILNNVWLKDNNDTSIGSLSDYLYDLYERDFDIENMSTSDILINIDWGLF